MLQCGFFDLDNRYQKLDERDPLISLNRLVDWEHFRPTLTVIREKNRKSKVGRKPYDVVLMFKVLVLQHLYNLSDDKAQYQIRDRYSFCRFLGLTPEGKIPDATTSAKNYPTQINKMCYSDAMKKTDGRSLPHSAREAIRRHAVAQVLSGESPEKVIKALGFHRSCIDDWLSRYEQGGEQALSTGKITGRPRKCPDEYADRLRELVKTNPLQLDFHDALWTRSMIQILLKDKFGIEVSERSVGNILSRLGMSAQRPRFKAYEQNPDQVKVWLRETWPEVQREAKRRRARVYFGDESTIRSDYHRGTTWGVRGDTPVVAKTGRRFSVNRLSAVSPKGHLRFMVTESRVTADVFIDFLRRLLHNAKRSVYLIVDGHRIHRAKKVQEFVRNSQGKLTLVWLPPYSPELNPDELVWHHVKSQRIGRTVVATKEQLMALARSVLHSLQQNTQIIKRFFYEKHVRYILN
ncbi:MAG: IS630 family transposase [Gammaproteobacteria bacterium]|nr:IS630 family transposase [Gammaproteobacteria bacterium]